MAGAVLHEGEREREGESAKGEFEIRGSIVEEVVLFDVSRALRVEINFNWIDCARRARICAVSSTSPRQTRAGPRRALNRNNN